MQLAAAKRGSEHVPSESLHQLQERVSTSPVFRGQQTPESPMAYFPPIGGTDTVRCMTGQAETDSCASPEKSPLRQAHSGQQTPEYWPDFSPRGYHGHCCPTVQHREPHRASGVLFDNSSSGVSSSGGGPTTSTANAVAAVLRDPGLTIAPLAMNAPLVLPTLLTSLHARLQQVAPGDSPQELQECSYGDMTPESWPMAFDARKLLDAVPPILPPLTPSPTAAPAWSSPQQQQQQQCTPQQHTPTSGAVDSRQAGPTSLSPGASSPTLSHQAPETAAVSPQLKLSAPQERLKLDPSHQVPEGEVAYVEVVSKPKAQRDAAALLRCGHAQQAAVASSHSAGSGVAKNTERQSPATELRSARLGERPQEHQHQHQLQPAGRGEGGKRSGKPRAVFIDLSALVESRWFVAP